MAEPVEMKVRPPLFCAGQMALPTVARADRAGETCDGLAATKVLGVGPSNFTGGPGQDVIVDLGGDDHIDGGGGDDVICAGDGDDNVFGGDGNDRIFGGPGNDFISGGVGDDVLFGPGWLRQPFGRRR